MSELGNTIGVSSDVTWTCDVCTLINPMHADHCDACETLKPHVDVKHKRNEGVPDNASNTASHFEADVWNCPQCTLENPPHVIRCKACRFARPMSAGSDAPGVDQYTDPIGVATAETDRDELSANKADPWDWQQVDPAGVTRCEVPRPLSSIYSSSGQSCVGSSGQSSDTELESEPILAHAMEASGGCAKSQADPWEWQQVNPAAVTRCEVRRPLSSCYSSTGQRPSCIGSSGQCSDTELEHEPMLAPSMEASGGCTNWECSMCTLHNPEHALACEACLTPRVTTPPPVVPRRHGGAYQY